jgi:hypothetical protein
VSDPEASAERAAVEDALRAVRREGWKAAAVSATVDGTCALVAVQFAVTVSGVDLPVPEAGPLSGGAVLAVLAGLLVGVGEFTVRVRRPLVDRFGAANPEVATALRTARDTVARGRDDPMARRLYADTRERLERASSRGLLDVRRLAATVVVVAVLGAATVGVGAAGTTLFGPADPGAPPGGGPGGTVDGTPAPDEYDGLRDGDEVLGTPGGVDRGSDDQTARVGTNPDASGERTPAGDGFDTAGDAATGEYDAQRAGFADESSIEDAELVREYYVRVQNSTDSR